MADSSEHNRFKYGCRIPAKRRILTAQRQNKTRIKVKDSFQDSHKGNCPRPLRTKAIPLILSINNHEDTQTINSSSLSVYQYGNHGTSAIQQKEVKEKMKQVADWQISNPNTAHEHHDLDWTNGALYVGMVDWAKLAEEEYNDSTYYQWLYKIGRRNCWQPHQRLYHADDITVSQSFIDLYRKYKKRKYWLLPWHVRNGLSTIHPTVHSNWSMVTTKP